MSAVLPPQPTSPGVGIRRKGPKTLPKLPLSAFSPPNTGTSEHFPLPPSPSTVHPEKVVDANVVLGSDLSISRWQEEAGKVLEGRVGGLVVTLPKTGADVAEVVSKLAVDKAQNSVLHVVVPFNLDAEPEESIAAVLKSSAIPVSLTTTLSGKATPQNVSALKWAIQQGRPINIDIQTDLSDEVFESLEDLLAQATSGVEKIQTITLSNLLPPPHQLELPIVKLMNHPTYRRFQAQVAALSLIPTVYIKYLPPSWEAFSLQQTDDSPSLEASETRQHKEWKRRIKMFLGPVMEAFGYQRIIFGSSSTKPSKLNAGQWYELARESLAELGVEQEDVDAVFGKTALQVYS